MLKGLIEAARVWNGSYRLNAPRAAAAADSVRASIAKVRLVPCVGGWLIMVDNSNALVAYGNNVSSLFAGRDCSAAVTFRRTRAAVAAAVTAICRA